MTSAPRSRMGRSFSNSCAGSALATCTCGPSSRGSPCSRPSFGFVMIFYSRNSRLQPPPPPTSRQLSTAPTPEGRPRGFLLLPTGVPPRQSAPPPPSVAPRPTTIPGSGRRRRKGGRGRGGGSGGPPATRGPGSWPSFYNPCTGSISMWPGLPAGHARPPFSLPSTLLHPHWRFRQPRHHLVSSRVSCPHRPPPMLTCGALGVADGTRGLLLGPSAR